MILALKTAEPIAEIYLLAARAEPAVIKEKKWPAERQLAHDLLGEVEKLVGDWSKLTGVIVFRGPGSFTGLRIGITTANTVAYARELPIVGTTGENWLADGLAQLARQQNDKIVLPEYGAAPHITQPKK
jgi:tRNA threonylcarbamoyladenosine biosynthesis protein TsaB